MIEIRLASVLAVLIFGSDCTEFIKTLKKINKMIKQIFIIGKQLSKFPLCTYFQQKIYL